MKVAFIGGGSHRLLGILRSAMAVPEIFDGGEIRLYDLSFERADLIARLLRQTPEFRGIDCRLAAVRSVAAALDGADAVGTIFMAGSQLSHARSVVACFDHEFIGTDNLSPSGTFLGVKSGPVLLRLARRMEKLCPKAPLINFCNPTAVLSGLINNHTSIRAFGVCEGVNNHRWDLNRILGRDEMATDLVVEAAGVNHLGFVMRGTRRGRDIFELVDEAIRGRWKPPASCGPVLGRHIARMVTFYRELGVLLYSGELDGTVHLCYEEIFREIAEQDAARGLTTHARRVRAHMRFTPQKRREMEQGLTRWLNHDLDRKFWAEQAKRDNRFARNDASVFVQMLRALAKERPMTISTSRRNDGAIDGLPDRNVVEYSQRIHGAAVKPAGHYTIPPVVYGMIAALSTHQTMIGDAVAQEDPRLLACALLAYPVRPYSEPARQLYKKLARINREEMPAALRSVVEFL